MVNMKKIVILLACIFLVIFTFACDQDRPGQGCGGDETNVCDAPILSGIDDIGQPLTGPYEVSVEQDPEFMTHTIFRPINCKAKMPVVVWGNGGCLHSAMLFGEFLMEIASHGFLVIADGQPTTETRLSKVTFSDQDGSALVAGIDWAFEVNQKECSQYYNKIDTTKVAAMGQSCGGLMTLNMSSDPRLTTIVIWNSGLFTGNPKVYDNLHTPVAYFSGGQEDLAYANAEADFAAITKVPVFWGDIPVGHGGTYLEDNGGVLGPVGAAWLKWQLLGETGPKGAGMFVGPNCGLCNTEWVIKKKNME
jgi:dienelactone hydrolase